MGVVFLLLIFGGFVGTVTSCDRLLSCDDCVFKNCQYVMTKSSESFCLEDYKLMDNLKMKVDNKKGCAMIQRVLASKFKQFIVFSSINCEIKQQFIYLYRKSR